MSEALKQQLVAAHAAVFDGVLAAVEDLDEAAWSTPTGCPGWDVRDQLSHMVGIERAMLGDPPDEVELPADLAHVTTDFDRVTEVAVEARRRHPADQRLSEARETFDRRLRHLEALDPDTLGEPLDGIAGMRMKASQLLRTRIFDLTCHEQDIRRALGRPGGLDGPNAEIAVEQVLRAWAKVLPARLGDDVVLDVEVAGHGRVVLDLAAGGIQRLATGDGDGAGEDPGPAAAAAGHRARWAALHLDAGALLALGTGRLDAPTSTAILRAGDPTLAAALVSGGTVTP